MLPAEPAFNRRDNMTEPLTLQELAKMDGNRFGLENQSTVGAKYVFMRMCKKKILQGRKFSALK